MELLEELHRDGATIVMVTHDPQLAARAQRNVHVIDGRVLDVSPSSAPRSPVPLVLRHDALGRLAHARRSSRPSRCRLAAAAQVQDLLDAYRRRAPAIPVLRAADANLRSVGEGVIAGPRPAAAAGSRRRRGWRRRTGPIVSASSASVGNANVRSRDVSASVSQVHRRHRPARALVGRRSRATAPSRRSTTRPSRRSRPRRRAPTSTC